MATTRATAKRLCTESEYELVESSFAPAVNALERKELTRGITRTRRLRDRFRTQAEGKAREMRAKAPPRGRAPARANRLTVAKQKLFDETLGRFEKQLAKLEARASKTRQSELAKKALAAKRAAQGGGERPTSRTASKGMKAKPAQNRVKGTFPAQGTKKGALSAAVKRGQARRDSRGR